MPPDTCMHEVHIQFFSLLAMQLWQPHFQATPILSTLYMHRTTSNCTSHMRCSVMFNIILYSSITQYEMVHENNVPGDEAKSRQVM